MCKVNDCDNAVRSIGLCGKHYVSFQRYGVVDGKPGVKKVCLGCNELFVTNRGAKYCSNECYCNSEEHKASRKKSRVKQHAFFVFRDYLNKLFEYEGGE